MTDVYAASPEPPIDVRLQYWNGHEDPVELVYDGRDELGTHIWVAVPTAPVASRYAFLKVGMLPPETEVRLRLA